MILTVSIMLSPPSSHRRQSRRVSPRVFSELTHSDFRLSLLTIHKHNTAPARAGSGRDPRESMSTTTREFRGPARAAGCHTRPHVCHPHTRHRRATRYTRVESAYVHV